MHVLFCIVIIGGYKVLWCDVNKFNWKIFFKVVDRQIIEHSKSNIFNS